jgi:1-deoxy-D-xylulose-5-phosphate synthase
MVNENTQEAPQKELLQEPADSLLAGINSPEDLKQLKHEQLHTLADELRTCVIENVSKTGGHLGAGLGVVELTVALHYVFNTPSDRLIWDVGHQAYPHKILTGRRDQMPTLRRQNGLSGFTKRSESAYDAFGAGHSSTSISAGLGMAVAAKMNDDNKHVISVIGDGSISAGMAYEGINNAAHCQAKMIIILNDNEMSIAPAVGAMSSYLCRLMSSQEYINVRNFAKNILHKLPEPIERIAKKAERFTKDLATGGNLFEELGMHYIGPIDGHNLDVLVPVLENIRDCQGISRPILLHVKTEKGRGFRPDSPHKEKYHAVGKFNSETGEQSSPQIPTPITYTKVFANTLVNLALQDENIIGITAAMPSGTGMDIVANAVPERVFDVGIAEQHAVTFAAGLAAEGKKPFVAIYSTFLQRAYDQIVHDVAIQKLPVRFAIDRAGFVGADGPTHAGSFDITYLASLPHFVVMAPSDECELARMIVTSYNIDDRPSAFRFPRGSGIGAQIPANLEPLEIGKGRFIRHGKKVAIISLGSMLSEAKAAADKLEQEHNISATIFDARFAKPLDQESITKIANSHDIVITVEEGAIGGFAAQIAQTLAEIGIFDKGLKFRSIMMPDRFIDHGTQAQMKTDAGLDTTAIYEKIVSLL